MKNINKNIHKIYKLSNPNLDEVLIGNQKSETSNYSKTKYNKTQKIFKNEKC